MGMSEFYGSHDDARRSPQSIAPSTSLQLSDTATCRPFTNEKLVGLAIRTDATEVVPGHEVRYKRAKTAAFLGISGKADYVRKSCDASLQRLGVDHIDLYYQHRVDRSTADPRRPIHSHKPRPVCTRSARDR